jgi:hypothetical protein
MAEGPIQEIRNIRQNSYCLAPKFNIKDYISKTNKLVSKLITKRIKRSFSREIFISAISF